MPGDIKQYRLNAERCLRTAKRARRRGAQQDFTAMAETWRRLAAEQESYETLATVLSALEFGEPYEALPRALKIHDWAA
jgi:hypothetical protein